MSNETKLLKMKKAIDEANTRRSEIEGEIKSLKSRLKEFDCKTVDEAKYRLEEMQADIDKLSADIDRRVGKLEEDYEW